MVAAYKIEFDPVEMPDTVDMHEFVKLDVTFDEVQQSLEHLVDLRDRILSKGKLTQDLAMESQYSLSGGSVLDCYFSGRPTLEKLRVSLEEVSGGILAAIIAGITLIVGVIYKLISSLGGGGSSSGGGGGGGGSSSTAKITPEYKEKVAEIVETAKEPAKIAKQTQVVKKVPPQKEKSLLEKFKDSLSEVEKDCLSDGSYFQAVIAAVREISRGPNYKIIFDNYWRELKLEYENQLHFAKNFDESYFKANGESPHVSETYIRNSDLHVKNFEAKIQEIHRQFSQFMIIVQSAAGKVDNTPKSFQNFDQIAGDPFLLIEQIGIVGKKLETSGEADSQEEDIIEVLDHIAKDMKAYLGEVESKSKSLTEVNIHRLEAIVYQKRLAAVRDYMKHAALLAKLLRAFMRYMNAAIHANNKAFHYIASAFDETAKAVEDPDKKAALKESAKLLRHQADELLKQVKEVS